MVQGKELLLFLIVMMHCSSIVSKPVNLVQLQEKMKRLMWLPMENLNKAEEDYVQHVFEADPPQQFLTQSWKLLDGITLPVGNSTKEIQDSICAIRKYLEKLPNITRNIAVSPLKEWLLSNLTAFTAQFEHASKMAISRCHKNISDTSDTSDTYLMKEDGLKIIYFTKRWLIEFTDHQLSQRAP